MKRTIRFAVWGLAIAGILVGVGAAWLKWSPRSVPPGQPPLTHLDAESLPEFRRSFNAGQGDVRVLVLLSPT